MFELDPAFAATSHLIGDLRLCAARLQDDGRYPWIVLIPRRSGLRELEELDGAERSQLMSEIVDAGQAVRALGRIRGREVEKLNVGALGNVTPQLHVHVVGRRSDDAAWPGPVWGQGAAQPLTRAEAEAQVAAARRALGFLPT